jgi:hypothetical protein
MIGPVQLEAKIHFRIGDKEGAVTFGLAVGEPVTEQDLLLAIGKAYAAVEEQFADELVELMDADSFFNNVVVAEKTGQRGKFALPRSFDYDVSKLAVDADDAVRQEAKS